MTRFPTLMRALVLAALASLLGGCITMPNNAAPHAWNEGVWNSVLGYHGPGNTMGAAGGP